MSNNKNPKLILSTNLVSIKFSSLLISYKWSTTSIMSLIYKLKILHQFFIFRLIFPSNTLHITQKMRNNSRSKLKITKNHSMSKTHYTKNNLCFNLSAIIHFESRTYQSILFLKPLLNKLNLIYLHIILIIG
jgi:hypothetical protein